MFELNKLYLMDCMEGMKTFPDNYFDLAIVDPPYGLPKDSSNNRGKLKNRSFNKGHISTWDISPIKNYFNELNRICKNQIIWGGNYFDLPPTREIICWDKLQPWINFSQWELAWTSFNGTAKIFRYNNRVKSKIHPTEKPVQLYKWLLNQYSKPNFKIIDTHAGSCSSVIAFLDYGCDWIAFEIDKDYYEAASKRIENHKLQFGLWT